MSTGNLFCAGSVCQRIRHTIRERLDGELIKELSALMEANHAAVVPETVFAPNWSIIMRMSPQVWVTRIGGRAVGYCAHLVTKHVFTGEDYATCAAIYMLPAHRGFMRAVIVQVGEELAEQGVRAISYSVPHKSRAGSFFEAVGYECAELVMTKRVDALLA